MKDLDNSRTIELLSSADPTERRLAIESVDPAQVENLEIYLSALQDDNKGVRDAASQILSMLPTTKAAEKLVCLLESDSISIRNLASELLIAYGEIAVEPLLSELRSHDGDVRKFVVDILGLIRDNRAFDGLVQALDDEEPNVVVSAAEALGNLKNLAAAPCLIAHFHSVEGMEYVVIEALGKLRTKDSVDFLLKVAVSDELTEAQVALNALQFVDDAAIADDLYKQLQYLDPILRDEAVASILSIHLQAENSFPDYFDAKQYTEGICELLNQKDFAQKIQLIQVLPKQFVAENILFFIGLNGERDEELDYVLTTKLAEMDSEILLREVKENFKTAGLDEKLSLSLILAQKDMPAAVPFLEKLISLPQPEVKENILQVVSAVPDPAVIPLLKQLIEEGDEATQESAYFVLANFKEKSNQPIFEKGLQSNSTTIKEICGEAMSQIAPDRLSEIVTANLASSEIDELIFALDIVSRFSTYGSFQVIVEHLDHEAAQVRLAAVNALANFEHSEVYDAVEFLLTDPDTDVRRAAFDALLKINPDEAERPARAALSDENFWLQIAGIECVTEHRLLNFKNELCDLLGSENKMVQMKSIEALLALFGENIEKSIAKKLSDQGEDGVALLTTAKEQQDANWF
ncbi:MAG: HEAT repeat domain-containing protein [Calditrichaeota bacterium]|nr:MAG: HEAT repeat domain-containing protein [Calditrichota bacterium]